MVKRILVLISIICFSKITHAQNDSTFVRSNMIKAALTISPSAMLGHSIHNIYLDGDFEYFFNQHLSFRGEGLWYIDSQEKVSLLKENSTLCFGPLYHINKKQHDLFVGLQTGLSFTSLNNQLYNNGGLVANPNVSIIAGYTFYFFKYFHFFVNCRYMKSTYQGTDVGAVNLDELIFAGGLGWQIRFKSYK